MSTVYLIHFNKKLHHAGHYLGFTENLDQRLTDHLCGMGARLMEVVVDAGIEFKLARVWNNGSRKLERKLKSMKCAPRLCPICSKTAMKRAVIDTQLSLFDTERR